MLPVIALVGRPNVGKSTLFNQLTRSRDALVADYAGLTRDRKYGEARLGSRPFIVIDTGGVSGDEDGIDQAMADQSMTAIEEADAVLLMVDAREGLNAGDEALAQHLRQRGKPIHLIVNKVDGISADVATGDFYSLGGPSLFAIAASQGRGVRSMIEAVLGPFPEAEQADGEHQKCDQHLHQAEAARAQAPSAERLCRDHRGLHAHDKSVPATSGTPLPSASSESRVWPLGVTSTARACGLPRSSQ